MSEQSPAHIHTVTIGSLELRIAKLTLGQLRRDETLLAAINRMQQLAPAQLRTKEMPSADHFSTMLTIVVAAARANTPDVSAEAIEAAFDDEPFDLGLVKLAECVALATVGRKLRPAHVTGDVASGEAQSPSSSTSLDSTGSSSPRSATASATSTN